MEVNSRLWITDQGLYSDANRITISPLLTLLINLVDWRPAHQLCAISTRYPDERPLQPVNRQCHVSLHQEISKVGRKRCIEQTLWLGGVIWCYRCHYGEPYRFPEEIIRPDGLLDHLQARTVRKQLDAPCTHDLCECFGGERRSSKQPWGRWFVLFLQSRMSRHCH